MRGGAQSASRSTPPSNDGGGGELWECLLSSSAPNVASLRRTVLRARPMRFRASEQLLRAALVAGGDVAVKPVVRCDRCRMEAQEACCVFVGDAGHS